MHKQASGPRACHKLILPAEALVASTRSCTAQKSLSGNDSAGQVARDVTKHSCGGLTFWLSKQRKAKSPFNLGRNEVPKVAHNSHITSAACNREQHCLSASRHCPFLHAAAVTQSNQAPPAHREGRGFLYLVESGKLRLPEAANAVLANKIWIVV